MRKKYLLIGITLLLIILSSFLLFMDFSKKTVTTSPDLSTLAVNKDSTVITDKDTSYFDIQGYDGSLYRAKSKDLEAAKEFIAAAPRYKNTQFIPENFLENSRLERALNDRNEPLPTGGNMPLSGQHYFYNQRIHDIPVFNGQLVIHLRNNNEIYSVTGNLITNNTVEKITITNAQAQAAAMKQAAADSGNKPGIKLAITKAKQYILNKKILGISDDEKNYVTLAVTIADKEYFVDLTTGKIIYEQKHILHALNRQVSSCSGVGDNGASGCKTARTEGQAASSNAHVNSMYDKMGTYYNFIKQTFQRDSINGSGLKLIGNAISSCSQPDAFWDGTSINICPVLDTPDVTYHELTHGLIEYTAKLTYTTQSGTLNEAIADIFSIAIKGTYLQVGPIGEVKRDTQNPANTNQPDMLFSTRTLCDGSDDGGVHINSTIISHAFYLMSAGGNQNNCAISPIGRLIAIRIQYRAITTYLTGSANFKSYYTAMNNACNDLYQSTSSTCRQVKAAMMAVQIDQQPAGTQTVAKCANITAKPVQCPAAVNAAPSTEPTGAAEPTQPPVEPTFACLGSCPTGEPTMPEAIEPTIDPGTDQLTDPATDPVTDPMTAPATDPMTDPGVDTGVPPETNPETNATGSTGTVCKPKKKLNKKKKKLKKLKKKLKKAKKNGKKKKVKKLKKKIKKVKKKIKKLKKKVNNKC